MSSWSLVVDLVRAVVFSTAHLFGNSLGSGILAVSVAVRVALLPLTLRAARRMLAHQARVAELAPELDRLKRLHSADNARLAEETMSLYRQRDVPLAPRGAFGALLVQAPIGAALYQAISGLGRAGRFLWIGDLARPDAIVVGIAAVLAGLAASSGTANATRANVAVSALLTLLLAWRLSAGVGLYWVASNSVAVVQSVVLRREARVARRS